MLLKGILCSDEVAKMDRVETTTEKTNLHTRNVAP